MKAKAGRPTAQDLELRKARILDVASANFRAHGFSAASLTTIAREARVTARTIYDHFGDKADLFRAVIRRRPGFDTAIDLDIAPQLAAGVGVREILLGAAMAIVTVTGDEGNILFQRMLAAETQRFPEMTRSLVAENVATLEAKIVALLDTLHAAHLLPRAPGIDDVRIFNDLMQGSHAYHRVLGLDEAFPSRAMMALKVDGFLAMLAAR